MSENRIPSLDGWRGLSIIFVVAGHQLAIFRAGLTNNPKFLNLFELHNYGVQIFFVLSGFLITNLLIKENSKYGRVSLYNFYMRRIFRIIPAYFTYLLIVLFLSYFYHGERITWQTWMKAFFFLSNVSFWGGMSWSLGHTWSLAVEEQYYIVWPALFRRKQVLVIPLIFVCIAPISRLVGYKHPEVIGGFSFFSHVDSIFWGALFAVYVDRPIFSKFVKCSKFVFIIATGLLVMERFSIKGTGFLTVPFVKTFFSLSIISMIYYSIHERGLLYKLFNNKALAFIGVLSYSIYLWQQVFQPISILGKSLITTFPLNWIIVFICAYLSNKFIEQPFLRQRAGFMKEHGSEK